MAKSVERMACSIRNMAVLYSSGDRDWNKNQFRLAVFSEKILQQQHPTYLEDVVGILAEDHDALVQMVVLHRRC